MQPFMTFSCLRISSASIILRVRMSWIIGFVDFGKNVKKLVFLSLLVLKAGPYPYLSRHYLSGR